MVHVWDERGEILADGGSSSGVDNAITGKLWQYVCTHQTTRLRRKPQPSPVSRANPSFQDKTTVWILVLSEAQFV